MPAACDTALQPRTRAGRLAALAAAVGLGLGGCAGGEQSISTAVKPVASATGFATTVPEPQDFVQKTRPANQDYLPVGVTPPSRGTTLLTKDQLAGAEQDLEATRAAHDRLAGRKPPPAPGQAAAKTKPKPKKQGETGSTSQ